MLSASKMKATASRLSTMSVALNWPVRRTPAAAAGVAHSRTSWRIEAEAQAAGDETR